MGKEALPNGRAQVKLGRCPSSLRNARHDTVKGICFPDIKTVTARMRLILFNGRIKAEGSLPTVEQLTMRLLRAKPHGKLPVKRATLVNKGV